MMGKEHVDHRNKSVIYLLSLLSIVFLSLFIIFPSKTFANQNVPSSDCSIAYGQSLASGNTGWMLVNPADTTWTSPDGKYYYEIFGFALIGNGTLNVPAGSNTVDIITEDNSWDCNNAKTEADDLVYTDGTVNQNGSSLDYVNSSGRSIRPDAVYLGVPYGSPNSGKFEAGISNPANIIPLGRPPVFQNNYNSAAAFVDDGGRAVIGGLNGDQTLWCTEFTDWADSPDAGFASCGPNVDSGATDQAGSGAMQSYEDCHLSDGSTYLGGKETDGSSYQCNGSTGDVFSWYDQYALGGDGSNIDMTPLIGTDAAGNLHNFYLHMSGMNTQKNGFTQAFFMTFRYPTTPPALPTPTISATASCTPDGSGHVDVTGTTYINGNAYGGLNVSYGVTNNESQPATGSVTSDSSGNYSIQMDAYDLLTTHTISVSTPQIDADGGVVAGGGSGTASATLNPCYVPDCTSVTLSVPGIAPGTKDGPVPGQSFTTTVSISFDPKASSGASSESQTPFPFGVGGNIVGSFSGAALPQTVAGPGTDGSATFTWTAPTSPGSPPTYTYSGDYDDSANSGPSHATIPCTAGTTTIGYHPYVYVDAGDVLVGSGGSTATCGSSSAAVTNAINGAGILGYNTGQKTGLTGGGTQLSSFAPDIINEFSSSSGTDSLFGGGFNGTYTNAEPGIADTTAGHLVTGLAFANYKDGSTYNFDSLFGGGFGPVGSAGCSTDYYGEAPTAVPGSPSNNGYTQTSSVTLSNASPAASPLDNSSACQSSTNATTSVTSTNCFFQPTTGSPLVINGGTNLTGKTMIFVNGDVEITGNITLSSSGWTNVAQIPNLYIVSNGNIFIDSSVTNLQGVYVAQADPSTPKGDIFTCTNGYSMYASSALFANCSSQLNVTGAFVANEIRFERTKGTQSGIGADNVPAEYFHYPTTTWLQQPSLNSDTLPTNPVFDSITALPPVL